MRPRFGKQRRFGLEGLEDRSVPSGCQAFGAGYIAVLAQAVVPAGSVIVSPIAQSGPGAVAAELAADRAALCS